MEMEPSLSLSRVISGKLLNLPLLPLFHFLSGQTSRIEIIPVKLRIVPGNMDFKRQMFNKNLE